MATKKTLKQDEQQPAASSLSAEFKRGVEILKTIEKLTDEYQKIFDNLETVESNMIGGIIVAIYSPVGGVGYQTRMGNRIVTQGLQSTISEKAQRPSFLNMLGG